MVFVVGMALLVKGEDTSGIRWDDEIFKDGFGLVAIKCSVLWRVLN